MIRKFRKEDTLETADLARDTFIKYNGNDYFDIKGIKAVTNSFDTSMHSEDYLYSVLSNKDIFYVYEIKNTIVGMIRGDKNRIGTLFVKDGYQGKGIGKLLINTFEKDALNLNTEYIKIHASLYAVKFYESMGYKKSTGIRNFKGLKIYNMIKRF